MYGQFNGNIQYNGFPGVQNRLGNQEGQYSGYRMPAYLKGRMVTSIDEAKASQFDLDGTITFFPSLNEGRIYAKTLDNNGLPVFMQFVMQQEQPKAGGTAADIEMLLKRIERIEKELGYETTGNAGGNAKQ